MNRCAETDDNRADKPYHVDVPGNPSADLSGDLLPALRDGLSVRRRDGGTVRSLGDPLLPGRLRAGGRDGPSPRVRRARRGDVLGTGAVRSGECLPDRHRVEVEDSLDVLLHGLPDGLVQPPEDGRAVGRFGEAVSPDRPLPGEVFRGAGRQGQKVTQKHYTATHS